MQLFCPWEPAKYLVYSSNVPNLLYYSHIIAIVAALVIGFLVYFSNKKNLISKVLLSLFVTFSVWASIDIILWATNDPAISLFYWSLQIITEIFIFLLALYLVKVYVGEEKLPKKVILILTILLLPVLVIMPTKYGLSGITLKDCYAVESQLIIYLTYTIEIFISIWIIKLLVKYNRVKDNRLKEIKYFTVGITLFLIAFSFGNIVGSFTDNWVVAQYGLFGMPIFVGLLTYIIVKYQTFNIKLIATQALVWGLSMLIGSQFLFIKTTIVYVLTGITFFLVIIFGNFLVKSVKREVEQKERLQELSLSLEKSNLGLAEANDKLKGLDKLKTEFLSLASHQLRTPLTAIKGYASMLSEGAFGNLDEKQDGAVKRIYTSAQGLTNVVEDLLNVSKIEQGGMKYEFSPTNLSTLVTQLYNEMKVPAETKNLDFSLEMDAHDAFIVSADATKLKQVFLNLTDNSIKYTMKGFVKISLKRDGSSIVFTVSDNGMGISAETKAKLFEKFSRGEGGKTNTGGSGLGLYLAQQIARAHKGDVVIESEGLGKGSKFIVTLPASGSYPN